MSVTRNISGFILAAAFVLPGCAGVLELDNALAVTPYRVEEGGRIVIEAHINGQGPFDFVLDSASSISAVFGVPRRDLDLEPIPGKAVIIHGAVASGQFPLLDIERLEVGREAWARPRIVSLPGNTGAAANVDGLLGVDFLRQYAIGFSTSDRVVRLYPPNLVARRSYSGWASVSLAPKPIGKSEVVLYFLTVDIDGHSLLAVFDLGAGLNIINWAGARSLGLTEPRRRDKHEFAGALERATVVATLRANTVTTAGIDWRNEVFSIADFEIFKTLMRGDRPTAILGAGLFTQRDFVIDFVRNRLLVRVSMDEASPEVDSATEN